MPKMVSAESIFPLRDLAFEHRMYLPLITVAVLAVFGGEYILRRLVKNPQEQKNFVISVS